MRIEGPGLSQAPAGITPSTPQGATLKVAEASGVPKTPVSPKGEDLFSVWAPPGSEATRTEALAQKLNDQLRLAGEDLHFEVHEKTGRIIVQVVDEKTQEVRRELPPEQLLDVMASLAEASGLRVDRQL